MFLNENAGAASDGPAEGVAVLEPVTGSETRPRRDRPWYVILHDDQLHTYRYVIEMLIDLFKMSPEQAFLHAVEVDTRGVTILARLPKTEAACKRDQIHAYGGDPWLRSSVSMRASIEPCDD